jgi:hypothetical protein
MTEYIVYVKIFRNKRLDIGKIKSARLNGSEKSNEKTSSGKLIYFEIKKNIRIAQAAENKFKSLTRNKLIEMIRKSNPELLDLKNTLNQNDHLKELVY